MSGRTPSRNSAGFPPTRVRAALPGLALATSFALLWAAPSFGQQMQYQRPVTAAPSPQDIGEGYTLPEVQWHPPRALWREFVDLGVLAGGLGLAALVVLKWRSRLGAVAIAVGGLLYFGVYRQGCVCPIGAIQNVTVALADPDAVVSLIVITIFFLPLIAALFVGRVFCGGVCPLGAIQELVLVRPVHVPRKVEVGLRSLKWVYLGLAIVFAALPLAYRDFLICRYDPFVGFFRLAGPLHMLLIGGGFLLLGLFIGRPYCRYLCPYGALLSLGSRWSWKNVSITPDKELDCGLCADACPYGAIKDMRAERGACLACGRCYKHCPREHVRRRGTLPLAGATATSLADVSRGVRTTSERADA